MEKHKKRVIAYAHTHWDREWYREFEVFRVRLLTVFDNILNMLENNSLPSFYFDGQTSALQDYLEMRPEKTELVKKLIKDKKLFIGPFYCLIDEFLTDEKTIRKNLELGLEYSKSLGCNDFIAYFADTFGHTPNLIPILKEYNINTAVVWRGCGNLPTEFSWGPNEECTINTINLVRGYFNDYLNSTNPIENIAKGIKNELDKIAEKSGKALLMPIGGDHLGISKNLQSTINQVNQHLEDYQIEIGSIFDYIHTVKQNFKQHLHIGELRDNSKTFTLQGSFSARLDLKKWNIETSHLLDKAEELTKYFKTTKYNTLIEYAYKLLLQNQAHDSIYGCSLDDVHKENIVRYKKIQQIANSIIKEIRFENNVQETKVINLGTNYNGTVKFESCEKLENFQLIKTKMGFEQNIMSDTLKVPITEDYREIYTYLSQININQNECKTLTQNTTDTDVFATDKCIGNSKIFLNIEENTIKIGRHELKFMDFIDLGDSYNEAPDINDLGLLGEIISSKVLYSGHIRSALEVKIQLKDILTVIIELDNESELLKFNIDWENTYSNHNLQVVFDTLDKVKTVYSEDTNQIIKREFDPDYDIRKNLPQTKGQEAKTNTAPLQRGVWANGIGIVTNGQTLYEVRGAELALPILRSTSLLSNPKNPARTTPAGPPLELNDLKQLGHNSANFSIFIGKMTDLEKNIANVFNKCV